jgi:hypothetical protein
MHASYALAEGLACLAGLHEPLPEMPQRLENGGREPLVLCSGFAP